MNLIEDGVHTDNFEVFIQQHNVIFFDFWAKWCEPCKQFADVFAKVATQCPEIMFVKINIEQESALAELFNIRSIPHLMVFKEGIAIYSEAGSMPESALLDLVNQALAVDVSELSKELAAKNQQALQDTDETQ